jgi:hypothetical protein
MNVGTEVNLAETTLTLVRQALDDLDAPQVRLSAVMRKALRVARLRNDWSNVYWIHWELLSFDDRDGRRQMIAEAAPYFDGDTFRQLHKRTTEASISCRVIGQIDKSGKLNTEHITSVSIAELEDIVSRYEERSRNVAHLPNGLHPVDAYTLIKEREASRIHAEFEAGEFRRVLGRIAHRVHSYLSQLERQLLLGQFDADILEQNRQYVDGEMRSVAPEALKQLQAAYRCVREGTAEARSHALTSCRRALKSLADRLYPPKPTPVRGADGKDRTLNDQQFVSRLWQFIHESRGNSASKPLLQSELQDLGGRIDRLHDLASKGVHAQVSEFEVNLCVIGTYSIAGVLLRLKAESSASTLDPEAILLQIPAEVRQS